MGHYNAKSFRMSSKLPQSFSEKLSIKFVNKQHLYIRKNVLIRYHKILQTGLDLYMIICHLFIQFYLLGVTFKIIWLVFFPKTINDQSNVAK